MRRGRPCRGSDQEARTKSAAERGVRRGGGGAMRAAGRASAVRRRRAGGSVRPVLNASETPAVGVSPRGHGAHENMRAGAFVFSLVLARGVPVPVDTAVLDLRPNGRFPHLTRPIFRPAGRRAVRRSGAGSPARMLAKCTRRSPKSGSRQFVGVVVAGAQLPVVLILNIKSITVGILHTRFRMRPPCGKRTFSCRRKALHPPCSTIGRISTREGIASSSCGHSARRRDSEAYPVRPSRSCRASRQCRSRCELWKRSSGCCCSSAAGRA